MRLFLLVPSMLGAAMAAPLKGATKRQGDPYAFYDNLVEDGSSIVQEGASTLAADASPVVQDTQDTLDPTYPALNTALNAAEGDISLVEDNVDSALGDTTTGGDTRDPSNPYCALEGNIC